MARWIEQGRVGDLVDLAAARLGDREALSFQGRRWSFAALRADVDGAARGLMYPLTSSGKVQKFVLRERALAQLSARATTAPEARERAG